MEKNEKLPSEFSYPSCWNDELRMQVLFAPFRERNVNPQNYDSKLKFWKDIIKDYCLHKGEAIISKQQLLIIFARKNQIPLCMDTIIQEMQKSNSICVREDYEQNIESTWIKWLLKQFIRNPLSWSLNKLWSSLGLIDVKDNKISLEYVHLDVLNIFCCRLQQILKAVPFINSVHEYEIFKQNLNDKSLNLTDGTLNLCLITLHYQRNIGLLYKTINEKQCIHLIKIPDDTDKNPTITEIDEAIVNLETTKINLEKYIKRTENDILDNKNKIKNYLKNNERLLAKHCLRKIHLQEKSLEKQSLCLLNIEQLILNIDDAKYNGVALDAYKTGSKALKNLINNEKLQLDHVDDVILELQDTLNVHNEIQETIGNASLSSNTISKDEDDDAELENELNELLNESNNNEPIATITNAPGSDNKNKNKSIDTTTVSLSNDNKNKSESTADISALMENLKLVNKDVIEDNNNTNSVLN